MNPAASPEKLKQCTDNLKVLANAVEKYRGAYGFLPKTLNDLVPNVIRELPKCPMTNTSKTYEYQLVEGKNFIICVKGGYWTSQGCPVDYPRYDSRKKVVELRPGVVAP